jgi:hypothetical protein
MKGRSTLCRRPVSSRYSSSDSRLASTLLPAAEAAVEPPPREPDSLQATHQNVPCSCFGCGLGELGGFQLLKQDYRVG